MITIDNTPEGVHISGYQVTLKPVQSHHLKTLQTWRNSDFVRQQMVSTDIISDEQQQAWFASLQRDNSQQHWVVYYKDAPIGTTNIRTNDKSSIDSASQLSPGLYIGEPKYQGNILAFAPTLALYDFCFDCLKINTLQAQVKQENSAALNYNKKLGYQEIDRKDMVTLELDQARYQSETQMIKRLLSR